MRILITGCGGMLGEAVYTELKDKYIVYATDMDLNENWLGYLDIRSFEQVNKYVKMIEPGAIIHLAALTDLEYCELNPSHAYDVNFMGSYNMARVSSQWKIPLVYISSAGIFDGSKQIYDETDIPNPLNVYAKSKYAGELAILAGLQSIVVRASWMMGGGPKKDKKFINNILKQIRNGKKELFVVDDKFGNITYTYDLAKKISFLLEKEMYGLFHSTCAGGVNRVDITRKVLEHFGLEKHILINAVKSSYFKQGYFVNRPYSEKLVSIKMNSAPAWQDCLIDYLNRFEWKI